MFEVMKIFTSPTQKMGERGETMAEMFLVKHEHEILNRNVGYYRGEIDIVTKKGDRLYFFEIKSTRCFMWNPLENMSTVKLNRFRGVVELYRKQFHVEHLEYELWCLAIYLNDMSKTSRIISLKI